MPARSRSARRSALAKQDYLATLTTLQGIDQKAVLQATLYGLPMTGFDAPGRQPIGGEAPSVQPTAVTTGPGSRLGLFAGNLGVNEPNDGDDEFYVDTPLDVLNDPPGTRHSKYSEAAEDADVPDGLLTWREGLDGVTVEPGMPALPKQVVNVTANGLVLRGVGFRAGYYRDTGNLVPLTGAPAIEGGDRQHDVRLADVLPGEAGDRQLLRGAGRQWPHVSDPLPDAVPQRPRDRHRGQPGAARHQHRARLQQAGLPAVLLR